MKIENGTQVRNMSFHSSQTVGVGMRSPQLDRIRLSLHCLSDSDMVARSFGQKRTANIATRAASARRDSQWMVVSKWERLRIAHRAARSVATKCVRRFKNRKRSSELLLGVSADCSTVV